MNMALTLKGITLEPTRIFLSTQAVEKTPLDVETTGEAMSLEVGVELVFRVVLPLKGGR